MYSISTNNHNKEYKKYFFCFLNYLGFLVKTYFTLAFCSRSEVGGFACLMKFSYSGLISSMTYAFISNFYSLLIPFKGWIFKNANIRNSLFLPYSNRTKFHANIMSKQWRVSSKLLSSISPAWMLNFKNPSLVDTYVIREIRVRNF